MAGDGAFGVKEMLAKDFGGLGLEKFTTKNINEGAILSFVEMHGNR